MVVKLKTQPNEKRCHTMKETHRLELKPCCPISGNPLAGSVLEIEYRVDELILEVAALRAYVDSYQGGRGDVRSMEGMCQQITQDCANAVQTSVWTRAVLNIAPEQQMIVECSANVSLRSAGRRVLAKHPLTYATVRCYGWSVRRKTKDSYVIIGTGPTEAEAWADAAKRLEGE